MPWVSDEDYNKLHPESGCLGMLLTAVLFIVAAPIVLTVWAIKNFNYASEENSKGKCVLGIFQLILAIAIVWIIVSLFQ